jgi:hypothetical protein
MNHAVAVNQIRYRDRTAARSERRLLQHCGLLIVLNATPSAHFVLCSSNREHLALRNSAAAGYLETASMVRMLHRLGAGWSMRGIGALVCQSAAVRYRLLVDGGSTNHIDRWRCARKLRTDIRRISLARVVSVVGAGRHSSRPCLCLVESDLCASCTKQPDSVVNR